MHETFLWWQTCYCSNSCFTPPPAQKFKIQPLFLSHNKFYWIEFYLNLIEKYEIIKFQNLKLQKKYFVENFTHFFHNDKLILEIGAKLQLLEFATPSSVRFVHS